MLFRSRTVRCWCNLYDEEPGSQRLHQHLTVLAPAGLPAGQIWCRTKKERPRSSDSCPVRSVFAPKVNTISVASGGPVMEVFTFGASFAICAAACSHARRLPPFSAPQSLTAMLRHERLTISRFSMSLAANNGPLDMAVNKSRICGSRRFVADSFETRSGC